MEKEKGKSVLKKVNESTPLTRQGYRTCRLAEDFWTAISMPNTPTSPRKTLRVIPILTKNSDQTKYLIDKNQPPPSSLAAIHVAELLAGIPWTTPRARQHVVNEVSQSLHELLIFNNSSTNPFQKWSQGSWFSQWTTSSTGDHICTLHAIIQVPESKIKVRKNKNIAWGPIPTELLGMINTNNTEEIQELTEARDPDTSSSHLYGPQPSVELSPNPFAALNEEETHSS